MNTTDTPVSAMSDHERALASLCNPHPDWSVRDYRATSTRHAMVAWHATLVYQDTPVAQVWDDGDGGAVFFDFTDPDAKAAFEAEERARYGDVAEAGSDYIQDLATAWEFNRQDGYPLVPSDMDLSLGQFVIVRTDLPFDQVADQLTRHQNPACREGHLWNKATSRLVPLASHTTDTTSSQEGSR